MKAAPFDSTLEFQHFKEVMRGVLAIPQKRLDKLVQEAKENSPRKGNPHAPGKKLVSFIRISLFAAGWKITGSMAGFDLGISITIGAKRSSATLSAATVLASALGDIGLTDMNRERPVVQEAQVGSLDENMPSDTICLVVGRIPERRGRHVSACEVKASITVRNVKYYCPSLDAGAP